MHESQESRSYRSDSRPVSHCDEEDAKPSVSKTSNSKSANHSSKNSDSEVERKNRTASGSRSHSSQRHSRTSQGVWGLVDINLLRHRVLPQGQGHRQVEDI